MGFPNKSSLTRVRIRLEKAEGTLMPSPNASPLEKLRWELCQKFVQYKIEHELSQEELAAILKDKSYVVARRTVAKYREQLGIPVARMRKELT